MRHALPLLLFLACSPAAPDATVATPTPAPAAEAPPLGRLPADVAPTHYALELTIDPKREDFQGEIAIDVSLERARDVIWLHGNQLTVGHASVTPKDGAAIAAHYEQVDPSGLVRLSLDAPAGPGAARIAIRFSGRFNDKDNGLYRVLTQSDAYAFTQMEPVWTRKAFPCFDEPAFKTPWDVRLVVPSDIRAFANTREIGREAADQGMQRLRFATSEPLPSYLIAFAVGPLDVVEAPPIPPNAHRQTPLPFRGIAAKGRGPELEHALAHTPAILKTLEEYFASGYPYDKLDIVAVPGKSGAMENVGLVTFREWLLLVDEQHAPVEQRRAFAYVMAHELAHMWFGNLVTMPWWDDIWLNEAFATWMGYRAVGEWNRTYQADASLLSRVHDAMGSDMLLSARQIRQPVLGEEDIHNAFDRITYRKGGGVLAMFERWMGPDTFQRGMRAYMQAHRHGSATVDDLLKALSEAAGKDVATPFRTFLFQSGLPNVALRLSCEPTPTLRLSQSRYLPLGSPSGAKIDDEKLWQIPVCVRYAAGEGTHEQCTLLDKAEDSLALQGCPTQPGGWLIPNAGGAGYYQWSLSDGLYEALLAPAALAQLTVTEKMSLARSLNDAFWRGSIDADRAIAWLEKLAGDDHPAVASAPMALYELFDEWLDPSQQKALQARAARLYAKQAGALGWQPRPGDSPETQILRREALSFMAFVARDEGVRKRGRQLAQKYIGYGADNRIDKNAVDPNAAATALMVYAERPDEKLYDALLYQVDNAADEEIRVNLLQALAAVRAPDFAEKSRDLLLHRALRGNELILPLNIQLGDRLTRDDTWRWLEHNVDALLARLSDRQAGTLPAVAGVFCSDEAAKATAELFTPRLSRMAGGRRELDMVLERIGICAAAKQKHLPALARMFAAP